MEFAALAVALVSLVLSTAMTFRQASIAHRANQLPVVTEILYQQRSVTFRRKEERVWDKLGSFDPSSGFQGLPEELRYEALEVAIFYQHLAYLVLFRIMDRRLAIIPVHYRIMRSWEVLAPFVAAERQIREGPYTYMNSFEILAEISSNENSEELLARLWKKELSASRRRRRRGTS